ncbi:MAG: formate dehydrogenase accessory sulfurtransferase FdhD [Gammaproteobacteria bacterium]|nr:formate dehydrogenase accessory sulfurtransferase FdhD [Gammaproteobacteria bacterium]
MPDSITNVEITKAVNDLTKPATDHVATEHALNINIQDANNYTLLCTPKKLEELAVGFLFNQKLIHAIADIENITVIDKNNITVELNNTTPKPINNYLVTSSSGMSANFTPETLLTMHQPAATTLNIKLENIYNLMRELSPHQMIFKKTGGTHAVAIFNQEQKIIAYAEDIGRHNAFDKVIGHCLKEKINLASCGAILSSRVSFEMAQKAARAGLGVIIAVSAPTSLAITAAETWNITLCGFTRDNQTNIYTHPDRITP